MLHRVRRVAPVRAAIAAVSLTLLAAAPSALAADIPNWPLDTKVLVQGFEGNQNLWPQTSDELYVHSHSYAVVPPAPNRESGPFFKVRMAQGQAAGHASHVVTLLDFTADDRPDILVDTELKIDLAFNPTFPLIGNAYVYNVSGTAGIGQCATVPPRSEALFRVDSKSYGEQISSRSNVAIVPLAGLKTAAGLPFTAGALDNPPRLISFGADQPAAGALPSGPARDTLPSAAATAASSCGAGQFSYDFSLAHGEYEAGSAAAYDVTHTDPADNAGGFGDLRRVSVQQRDVSVNSTDVVANRGQFPIMVGKHPTDLTIDFAPTGDVVSDTWIFKQTWSRSSAPASPSAQVRTEGAGAGRVKVTFFKGLPDLGLTASDRKRCLPTLPTVTGGITSRTYTVPLRVLGNGNRRIQIPIEELVPADGSDLLPPVDLNFRFHTISDPGQSDAPAPIDHVPLFAGYAQDGTGLATGCDAGGGDAGAQVYLDRSFTVRSALPVVELNASTTTPARGAPVTFDLGQTAAGARRCSFLRAFTPNDCSTPFLTQSYQQNATAYLALDTDAGPWDQAQVDIKVQNARPVAEISRVGDAPEQGTDGTFAIVQGAAVSVPLKVTGTDTDPGTTFAYRWTLDGGSTVSTAETYTPSFTAPGTHTVRAWVSDDSEDPGTEESLADVLTIEVVRSPDGEVVIARPPRVVNGEAFDIEAETTESLASYQALTWQWDLDGDADVDFDPARTTRALTGVVIPAANPAHLVRVRATDAGGRTADATISLNVRRANERPPLARFTVAPAAPKSGAAVTLDGSTSELSGSEGGLLGPVGANPADVKFHWSFGDGTPDVVTTTATTTHVYAGSGRPTATLTVEDARSTPSTLSDPVEKTIDVAPGESDANAPDAKLVRQDPPASEPVFANRPVTISAATSSAAIGHAPLTFAFDLDGNGTFERAASGEPTVTFTPPAAGPLAVAVKVTDAFASSTTASLALDVKPEPVAAPTAVIAGPNEVTLDGVSVDATYDATGSKGNNLDPSVTFRWDLDGDGTFETPTGAEPKITATFTESGQREVGVRVTDRYGNTADATRKTIVRSAADVAAGCTGDSSFGEAEYANIRLRGCVLTVERPSAGDLFVITGKTVQFNGMRLSERAGTRPTPRPFADCAAAGCKSAETAFNAAGGPWALALDTSDGSLRSNGLTSLRAAGSGLDLPLLGGALNVTLPEEPEDGFTLETPQAAELLGFPLAGSASLTFPDPGESVITVNVGLPSVLGGFTGTAGIRTTASGGVVLNELRIEVGEVALGRLTLGNLFFVYSRPEALWEGGASLTLPTPRPLTISAELAIQNNRFKRIWAQVAGLNQPIASAIYLQAIRAGVAVDPLDLTAGVSLSAGPTISRKRVLGIDGDMRLRFPSPEANYYLFAITGKLSVADIPLASAFAQFTSNGFFEMGGSVDVTASVGYFNAGIRGWMTKNAFNIDGDGEVGLDVNGSRVALLGGHGTLSTTGMAACGEIPVLDIGGGFGVRWGVGAEAFWGCDLSPYRATRPADAPATPEIAAGAKAVRTDLRRGRLLLAGPAGHRLEIPAKQEKALVTVTGRSAPPRVAIVDAGGQTLLSTPADGTEALTKGMLVTTDPKAKTTTILWKAPPGGQAWVVAQQGSPAVAKVDLALPAPKRTFGVTVGGAGYKRTLRWKITPALQAGETVQLAEEGAEAGTQLISTAKSAGSVPFAPQGGKAGQRNILATVVADGLPGKAQTVATYTAPPPAIPARAATLQLKRSSSGVLASWTPGVGGLKPAKWRAIVRVAHSQRKQLLVVSGSRTSVRIPNINPSDAVSVVLTGADAAGVEGPEHKAVIKAGLRASSGPLSLASTAVPRDVVVQRLGGNRLRVSWKTGPAFVRGWSIRVSGAQNGRRKGAVTLLRSAGDDHSVDFANVPKGELRVSVIGRRYQGTVTRKDVKYLGGTLRVH